MDKYEQWLSSIVTELKAVCVSDAAYYGKPGQLKLSRHFDEYAIHKACLEKYRELKANTSDVCPECDGAGDSYMPFTGGYVRVPCGKCGGAHEQRNKQP